MERLPSSPARDAKAQEPSPDDLYSFTGGGPFANDDNLSSSSDEECDRLGLRREDEVRPQSSSLKILEDKFQNEKFVFSTRSSNLEKFQNLKNQKELEMLIEQFWDLNIQERLEIIDNLDSIMTLVSSKELDHIIFSLFGQKEDYLSQSLVNNFYSEDVIAKGNYISEIGGAGLRMQGKRQSGLRGRRRSAKRKALNLIKPDKKKQVTKQERLRRLRHNFQDFIFKENKLRKKMLRTFPLILQKIYRTRSESFVHSFNNFNQKPRISSKTRFKQMSSPLSSQIARYSIRGSYHHIPEIKKPKGGTISLKRLSNKKMLQENIKMLSGRESDFMFQEYLDHDSDSSVSVEAPVEHEGEVRLLRTMLGFVIRRYKEHKEIKNIILCFESMRQIFSFCPKKIFHLVGLETIIDLLYNHLDKYPRSAFPSHQVLLTRSPTRPSLCVPHSTI